MKNVRLNEKQFQAILVIEEFRLWDATRNECSDEVIRTIKNRVDNVKAGLSVLENLLMESALS